MAECDERLAFEKQPMVMSEQAIRHQQRQRKQANDANDLSTCHGGYGDRVPDDARKASSARLAVMGVYAIVLMVAAWAIYRKRLGGGGR